MLNIDKILVPTDFSDNCDLALGKAVEYAAACGATLHLTYVLPEMPNIFKLSGYMVKGKVQEEVEQCCADWFEKQIARVSGAKDVEIKTKVLQGIPFKELLKQEKKLQPDLIVVAAKGETALEEVMFGGTASKIVRYAKGSVLLVKKPKYS